MSSKKNKGPMTSVMKVRKQPNQHQVVVRKLLCVECTVIGNVPWRVFFVLSSLLYQTRLGNSPLLSNNHLNQLQNLGKSSLFTKLRFLAKLPQLLSKETHKIKLSSQHSVAEHRSEDGRMEK